ncbi:hypothetical protein N9023_02655 [Opitutaceae bacterium]|nr:hypothetical protein [Opitutaceae bacterium]
MASPGKKSFLMRVDPKLWAEIQGWADQEMRSVNGQIEYLLRDAVRRRKGGQNPNQNEPEK